MASYNLKELKREVTAAEDEYRAAKNKLDESTWKYVEACAGSTEYKDGVFSTLHKYLVKHHNVPDTDAEEMLATIREGLTMAPITDRLSIIGKYDNRMWYDTILYKWQGKRITYVRADENSDGFHSHYTYSNGNNINDFDDTRNAKLWITEYAFDGDVRWRDVIRQLEECIYNSKPQSDTDYGFRYSSKSKTPKAESNIMDDLRSLPPEVRLIRIMFDMKESYCWLMSEEAKIKDVVLFMPSRFDTSSDDEADEDKYDGESKDTF